MILSEVAMEWSVAAKPYEWHRAIWRLFPNRPAESRQSREETRDGFLYRIERLETGQGARALVLSDKPPVTKADGIHTLRSTSGFNPELQSGQIIGFRLTANPVKTIVDAEGRKNAKGETKKCRVPLIREEEQRAWLVRQLDGIATPVQVEVRVEQPVYFRKGTVGKIVPVTFEGALKVTDGKLLSELMRKGIGPAKSFGCGLLLVRRIG